MTQHDHTQDSDDDPPSRADEPAQAGRGKHQRHTGDEIEPEPNVPGFNEAANAGLDATQLRNRKEIGRRR